MKEKKNQWTFLRVVLIGLLINGLIGVSNFHYLSYSGGAAGPILELFKQVQILAFSFAITLFFVGILFLFKKFSSKYIGVLVTLAISAYFTGKVSYTIANPKKATSQKTIPKKVSMDEWQEKETNRLLNKYEFFQPSDPIIQKDTSDLMNELRAILTYKDTIVTIDDIDENQLELTNNIFTKNFQLETLQLTPYFRKSMRCDFVTYSEDSTQFMAVITYESPIQKQDHLNAHKQPDSYYLEHSNVYNGIVMTCEKLGSKTLCFTSHKDKKPKLSRESYKNKKLFYLLAYLERENVDKLWDVVHVSDFIPSNKREFDKIKDKKYYSKEKEVNTMIGITTRYMPPF